ncbi:response regulator transcription factor, partial [Stutzerimonas stutzeri]|uniref:response regulator transcription factor n=1 Tax=Stutzerimonas stutzeri TaxID=316 RepID=UPI00210885CF
MSESASKRILMVEDEEDIAFLIRYMLERHGFVVDHAADGRQALDHFAQAAPPDLTLMDIMLPYHDGLELIERLRAQAGWESVPVLMLTAKAREVDIVRALELGADDYVTKPFQPEELLARIRRLLRGAGEARAAAACPGDTLHHGFGGYRHGRATGAGAATGRCRSDPARTPGAA